MKCTHCGNQIDNNAVFCTHCGTRTKKYENFKRISLRCKYCDGVLEVKEDSTVLECPYCGAKELIYFNDKKKTAENKSQKKGITAGSVFLIICAVFSLIIALCHLILNLILPALLCLLQAAGFITAVVLRANNPDKKKARAAAIIIALSWALAVPSMATCYYQYETGANLKSVDWSIFFLGDKVPQPKSKKIEIRTNTDAKLEIVVHGTSEEDFYKYVADCKTMGYTVDAGKDYPDFNAYNAEGYGLELMYLDNEMRIELTAPTTLAPLNWKLHEISEALPEPPSELGAFTSETKEYSQVVVGEISVEEYTEYFTKIKDELGYTIEANPYGSAYIAFNPDGYKIEISHNTGNSEMKIKLYQRLECSEITFPEIGVGALIPLPKSQSGKETLDEKWSYSVTLENMTMSDFKDYTEQCVKSGFSKNVRQYEKSYYADYSGDKTIGIAVSYEGFNRVRIHVSGEYSKDYSKYTRN